MNVEVCAQIASQCFRDEKLKEPFRSEAELKSRLLVAMDTVRARINSHRTSTPGQAELAKLERCLNGRRIAVSQ